MPKYFATVACYRTEVLIVEAENEDEAEKIAHDLVRSDNTEVLGIIIEPLPQEDPEED